MCNVILSLNFETQKPITMPKAQRKSVEEEEDDIPQHGPINKAKAKQYALSLDNIVIKMGQEVKDEAQDAMKKAITTYKDEICKMVSGMDLADSDMVWRSIKDNVSLCIQPQSDEVKKQLEYIIPGEETPTDWRSPQEARRRGPANTRGHGPDT